MHRTRADDSDNLAEVVERIVASTEVRSDQDTAEQRAVDEMSRTRAHDVRGVVDIHRHSLTPL